ncbi:CRISPR-associated protein Csm2 [Halolactibacillus halophilus]|uniref:CRISPR system Cms protein Csm2 n=1 Tax=Halolactibacillus halophilus TaxID=306540 RepID=A0A1I5P114_9BACI|nr:type III-A CRISPR-associated protein Csm2 [Halolactibacillus halophilus]GEM01540.1 type III-A CRISPR-associated protein Csm2 [Halolactibacillus halophilus]SFP27744.1 CRISPR-associated protein Csm2 [Halolactibacillus halophilus]
MATYQQPNHGHSSRPQLNRVDIHFKEETYVSEAEEVIKELEKKNFKGGPKKEDVLTTSQLRHLLSLTSVIYTEAQSYDFDQIIDRLAYLRVQFVYQSGRNGGVKKLIELADILTLLKRVQDNKDKKELIRFCRYMEALVAYFKYYGGRDQL